MNINLDLTDEQLVAFIKSCHEDDVDFLSLLIDSCTSQYSTISEIIKRLYERLPSECKQEVLDNILEEQE